MTRKDAREIAVRLCYDISAKDCIAREELEQFFERSYYDSLAVEDKLFEQYPDAKQREYITALVLGIGEHSAELDGYVEKYARGWKFSRISRTALAVLKTAMYEMMYMPEIPVKVAVNEAVEVSKHYETPETVAFINGVLGSFSREEMAP